MPFVLTHETRLLGCVSGGLRRRARATILLWDRLPDEIVDRIVILAGCSLPALLCLERRCWLAGRERLANLAPLYQTPFILPRSWLFRDDRSATIVGLANRSLTCRTLELLSLGFAAGALAHVKLLDLSGNHFGDVGLQALANVCAKDCLLKLETLLLRGNYKIGDSGLNALANVVSNGALPSLKTISVDRDTTKRKTLVSACKLRGVRLVTLAA